MYNIINISSHSAMTTVDNSVESVNTELHWWSALTIKGMYEATETNQTAVHELYKANELADFAFTLFPSTSSSVLKPKFHYADFATKSGTSSRQSRGRVANTNHESPPHKSRRWLSWFASTFPTHCNGLNSITATQTGLSRTCHGLCRKHLDMSRWFVSATFVICVGDFPRGEVSVKVGVMEFGLKQASTAQLSSAHFCHFVYTFW